MLILSGHTAGLLSIAFSPDGRCLTTASVDKTAKVWDVVSGQELLTLTGHTSIVNAVAFSPDGTRLATAGNDKTVRFYALNLEELMALARTRITRALTSEECKKYLHLEQCPQSVVALNLFVEGKQLARTVDLEGAAANFRKALELDSTLNFDPEREARKLVSMGWAAKGRNLARAGDINAAETNFRKALELDPALKIDPAAEARQFASARLLADGEWLARQGKIKQALAAYTEAQKLDSTLEISAQAWNTLCWFGSLWGHAADVVYACERAVTLDPNNKNIQNSRGVARALTGNINGAIEDFRAFISWAGNTNQSVQHQHWIKALQAGKNPFTSEEIKKLFMQ